MIYNSTTIATYGLFPNNNNNKSETKSEKKKLLEKKLTRISSAQSELSRTNLCLSSLCIIYIPQQVIIQ